MNNLPSYLQKGFVTHYQLQALFEGCGFPFCFGFKLADYWAKNWAEFAVLDTIQSIHKL